VNSAGILLAKRVAASKENFYLLLSQDNQCNSCQACAVKFVTESFLKNL